MQVTPKQIIIDKDAFVGIKLRDLCTFAGDHILLLCDTLWYECATTDKQDPGNLTSKCKHLVEEGGYVCSGNHAQFLQWEGRHCSPYPHCLLDLDATMAVRNGEVRCDEMANSTAAGEALQSRHAIAARMLIEPSKELKAALGSERPDVVKVLRTHQGNRGERLKMFLQAVDKSDIQQTAIGLFRGWIEDSGRFCTSPDWIAWQFVRIISAMQLEYHHIRQTGGPRDKYAEHDLQDIEYVLLLSRADALITQDKGLIELAYAAFPEKDVFSSLEEVPESYRCDWANR
jgi:hypothetical protein